MTPSASSTVTGMLSAAGTAPAPSVASTDATRTLAATSRPSLTLMEVTRPSGSIGPDRGAAHLLAHRSSSA